VGVSILAAVQFVSPADSALNLYSVVDGEEVSAEAYHIEATGRARVASTFSFISGFSDFCMLVPTLLLSIGLDTRDPKLRRATLIVTCLAAAVVPMSGSRASVLIGAAILVVTAWTAGLLVTRIGRRILIGGVLAAIVAVAVFPDAFIGVQSRFDVDETNSRFGIAAANAIPPLGLITFDYPVLGIGTGMMQNARLSMRIDTDKWEGEVETERNLIELGPVGFLVVWLSRLGLIIALFRAYRILKEAGRRGAAAGAMAYLFLSFVGNFTFDHIWQALYFLGCGFILAEVVAVVRAKEAEVGLTTSESQPVPAPAFARASLP
jgi:drug/metabolite transporter (DMT)-like permease